MSAEDIFRNYPQDEIFLESFRNTSEKLELDPIVKLGTELTVAARDSLHVIDGELEGETEDCTREEAEELFLKQSQDEHSALILGHLVVGLHEAMDPEIRTFDLGGFVAKYNKSITGTCMPKLELPEDCNDVIDIEHDELIGMRSVYSGDKTFTKFFRKPEYLPGELERFLKKLGIFESASFQKILPLWEQRAKLLVPTVYTTAIQKVEEEKVGDPLAGFTPEQRASFIAMENKYKAE